MNVHESEKLAGIIEARGYSSTDIQEEADIIVFNTCCIRENAENHVLGHLGIAKTIKEKKRDLVIAVCGCMTQQEGVAQKIKKRCPFVNIIFGTHNLYKFGEYLDRLNSGKNTIDVWSSEGEIHEETPIKRTSGINAWVNIMYGCNNFCSYCIVPYVRGRERSRTMENIIADVKTLLSEGYKEITLLGQNVNSYGNDLIDPKINFANLLSRIAELDGKFRVRFMTSHPKDLSDDVIKVIAQSPNLPQYFHIPAQAGSDKILKLMNRKYTQSYYLDRVDTIRKYMPDAGISGDMMVGFPSETEADFLDTLTLTEKVKYNSLFTFIYSRRSGTPADKMIDQIDPEISKDRITRLIDLQSVIGGEVAKSAIGKNYEVLFDTFNKDKMLMIGKTDCGRVVKCNSDIDLVGKFANVSVDSAVKTVLFGSIIK